MVLVVNVICSSKNESVYVDHIYIIHVECVYIMMNHHLGLDVGLTSLRQLMYV
jgi:hypothetical protein